MTPIESIRHDAAALVQFVDQVAAPCLISESPSYSGASKLFFGYILALRDATKQHLSNFAADLEQQFAQSDIESFYTDAQQIQTIRSIWFRLHEYVKPALDGDTLQYPHTLVRSLVDRLHRLPSFQNTEFAVLHTADLNYYQVSTGYIQRLASEIALSIPGSPNFPSNLGLVAIPYSQASALFPNLALAHEMGHFAFDQRLERTPLRLSVIAALANHKDLAALLQKGSLALQLCIDRCLRWLTEIYCDLFALSLVGPCFALGYIELFTLSRYSRNSNTSLGVSSLFSLLDFSDSHPAEALRLREQALFLQGGSGQWWHEINQSGSSQVELLRESLTVQNTSLTLSPQASNDINRIALDTFVQVVPEVHPLVEQAFSGVPSEVDLYVSQRDLIKKYLSFGVVPSRLTDGAIVVLPSLLALLNSAYFFYLDEYDSLLDKIENAQSPCVECRALWLQRLEMWTTKALEDIA